MIRFVAQFISIVFHPLFLFFYLTLAVYWLNPFSFRVDDHKSTMVLLIMDIAILVVLPMVATLMMRGLNFIQSLQMHDKTERIGPMITTIVFYVWFFLNVKKNASLPEQLTIISLGGTIALCIAFFINNFSKISLHTVGAGGFLAGMIILLFQYSSPRILLSLGTHTYSISPILISMMVIFLSGLIGTSRLILNKHSSSDVYGGYLVGLISMIVAYRLMTL